MTVDPIGAWSDPLHMGNTFSYAGNSPTSFVDPTGLQTRPNSGPGGRATSHPQVTIAWPRESPEVEHGKNVHGLSAQHDGSETHDVKATGSGPGRGKDRDGNLVTEWKRASIEVSNIRIKLRCESPAECSWLWWHEVAHVNLQVECLASCLQQHAIGKTMTAEQFRAELAKCQAHCGGRYGDSVEPGESLANTLATFMAWEF